jgi:hypothetical protein
MHVQHSTFHLVDPVRPATSKATGALSPRTKEKIMRKQLVCGIVLMLTLAAITLLGGRKNAKAEGEKRPMLAHNVFFSLKDNSAEAKNRLVQACMKYLSKHDGEVFFSAGTLAEDLQREVNDRDFDVALHIFFKDKASHDKYQDSQRHRKFIEENKENWKKVRVFDSVIRQ